MESTRISKFTQEEYEYEQRELDELKKLYSSIVKIERGYQCLLSLINQTVKDGKEFLNKHSGIKRMGNKSTYSVNEVPSPFTPSQWYSYGVGLDRKIDQLRDLGFKLEGLHRIDFNPSKYLDGIIEYSLKEAQERIYNDEQY